MTITGARNYIRLAPAPVLRQGVLSAATVIDSSDPHDLLGLEYQTDACTAAFGSWDEFCTVAGTNCPTYDPPELVKSFLESPDTVVGDPFVIYAGITCDIMKADESQARVARVLAYNEHQLVDKDFISFVVDANADVLSAVDDLALAVGALEHHLMNNYGGPGLIMAAAGTVESMCSRNLVYRDLNGELYTCLGTRVVANYASTAVAGSGTNIYITGQVTLVRGPVNTYWATSQELCDGDWYPPRALAERIYVPLVECVIASVEWTPPA